MERYIDQYGDLSPGRARKKSIDLDDVGGFVKKEISNHNKILDDKIEDPGENATCQDKAKFYAIVVKLVITGVLIPFFDMGTDMATAVTHFKYLDFTWGILTIFFVLLPGLVIAVAITIRGLRKNCTFQRTINFMILIAALPFLYPFIQILVNSYMLYLMFIRRTREVVKIMGHDVKQFKSLEGFLESGPQFVLQSYILLRGEKRGLEDLHNISEDDIKRLLTLVLSICLSFISLTKTGYNVNVPDPDDNRKCQQHPENARHFTLTSLVFHFVCVLFRVVCLSYFFAALRYWTLLVILVTILANLAILHHNGASYTISLLLGAVSIFMPNGYLLYNFAATFPVNFTYEGTRNFLTLHMLIATTNFLAFVVAIFVLSETNFDWFTDRIPANSVVLNEDVQLAMNTFLFVMGLLSVVTCYLHWRLSVTKLFLPPAVEAPREMEHLEDQDET